MFEYCCHTSTRVDGHAVKRSCVGSNVTTYTGEYSNSTVRAASLFRATARNSLCALPVPDFHLLFRRSCKAKIILQ